MDIGLTTLLTAVALLWVSCIDSDIPLSATIRSFCFPH